MNIKIIGLGGIGSILSENISKFLYYRNIDNNVNNDIKITLVDGDSYEPKNFERQQFSHIGKKSEVKKSDLNENYDSLISFESIPEYVDENNVSDIINEDDIIFICVDNHKSRNIINSYCMTLNNITVFSGGNELYNGNVQRFIKRNNIEITPNLIKYHPEIANNTDKHPNEMSCEELSISEPQLLFTNLGVVFCMLSAFYTDVILDKNTMISDSYFDILNCQILSKKYK